MGMGRGGGRVEFPVTRTSQLINLVLRGLYPCAFLQAYHLKRRWHGRIRLFRALVSGANVAFVAA